ncbi:unnamed protein product, partial [Amoebophrya sp. A25]|eukprot:GSA25T00000923001.1
MTRARVGFDPENVGDRQKIDHLLPGRAAPATGNKASPAKRKNALLPSGGRIRDKSEDTKNFYKRLRFHLKTPLELLLEDQTAQGSAEGQQGAQGRQAGVGGVAGPAPGGAFQSHEQQPLSGPVSGTTREAGGGAAEPPGAPAGQQGRKNLKFDIEDPSEPMSFAQAQRLPELDVSGRTRELADAVFHKVRPDADTQADIDALAQHYLRNSYMPDNIL